MGHAARLSTLSDALRVRDYRIYTSGNAVSLIGTWVQRIAVGWLTWELTGSGAWLGIMAFADLAPTVVVGPIADAVADRTDRLRLTRVSQAVASLLAGLLFLLSITGLLEIYGVLELTFASGVSAAFALNAISFAIFVLALARLRLERTEIAVARQGSLLSDLAAGYRYAAAGHPGLVAIFILMIVTCLCGRPLMELLPGFADAVFGAGALGLALLTSSVGCGAIIAGLLLGGDADASRMPAQVVRSSALLSLAILAFVATKSLWVAVPAMVVCGFAMAGTGMGSQTMIHLAVTPMMRGRVLSMHGMIFRGGPALGALAMGAASDHLGLRLPLALGACLILVAVAVMTLRLKALAEAMRMEEGADD